MNTKLLLEFLSALEQNNSLEWMKENRDYYLAARTEFERLLEHLAGEIALWDDGAAGLKVRDLTYRLNRDTRFSKDKRPYTPAFRAHISPGGKSPVPAGYYLLIQPGQSFLGGGVHAAPFPQAAEMTRKHICENEQAFLTVIENPLFQEHFEIKGEKLKRIPQGYAKDHPLAEYLKFKSWDLEFHLDDTLVADGGAFVSRACEIYRLMKPFNDFLNGGLRSFALPDRK